MPNGEHQSHDFIPIISNSKFGVTITVAPADRMQSPVGPCIRLRLGEYSTMRCSQPRLLLLSLLIPAAIFAAETPPPVPPAAWPTIAQVHPGSSAQSPPAAAHAQPVLALPTADRKPSPAAESPTADPPEPEPAPESTPPPPPPPAVAELLQVPAAGRQLGAGEMLLVAPGQNLLVESPAEPERLFPILDAATGQVAWVRLPARAKQVVAIRWLDTSNIKKLVEIEMLQGDLFVAVSPRGQTDRSLALRGRKIGLAVPTPDGWKPIAHRSLKLHCEVDASLRLVGFGHPLLPGNADRVQTLGLHIFASLRPGSLVQNAGATTLVVEQYDQEAVASDRARFTDNPRRVLLPPETSLTTNGGQFDLRHFYIPEPGQPGGPDRIQHVHADMPAVDRSIAIAGGEASQADGSGRAAEAPAGALP